MTVSALQIALMLLTTVGLGGAAGFIAATLWAKRRCIESTLNLQQQADEAVMRVDEVRAEFEDVSAQLAKAVADRTQLAEWATGARAKLSRMKNEVEKAHSQVRETVEKGKRLQGTVGALRAEREETKARVTSLQKTLVAIHQRTLSMQKEFEKASEFYKRELEKSLKARKRLEHEVATALEERKRYHEQLQKSVEEKGSKEDMVQVTHLRRGQMELLERNNKKLRSEKAELYEDINELKNECAELKREVAELEEHRIHNQQLVQALEALEKSRAQHEKEASQYKDEADQLSASLKMKLSDIEESFAAMEQEQNDAIQHVRETASAQPGANEMAKVVGLAS